MQNIIMKQDLTKGNITKSLILFTLPLMLGNILQQLYNLADTLIVGRFIGSNALAAVGTSYMLMVFLTSILLGLCMGCSAYFSIQFGKRDYDSLKTGMFISFILIGGITILINVIVYAKLNWIMKVLQVPVTIWEPMREYLVYVLAGIFAVFLYDYFSNLLRAIGNSVVPILFLGASVILNVALDVIFIVVFRWGIAGAAAATVISQYIAGIGIAGYYFLKCPELHISKKHMHWDKYILKNIFQLSFLTCLQQSVMNFGILMVQGIVNSFGAPVMAAFAVAVKIDTIAYMPIQDFGNAFSTFVAQNYGAEKRERIWLGIKSVLKCVFLFSVTVSVLVCIFAEPLMKIFIEDTIVVNIGVEYLRIEAAFYLGIGILYLLYGYYRAVEKPGMSLILTVCSLGTRVILAYILSSIPSIGVTGIWAAIPIGWFLADMAGMGYYILNPLEDA